MSAADGEFDLTALVQRILAETSLSDPGDIAQKLLVPSDRVGAVLAEARATGAAFFAAVNLGEAPGTAVRIAADLRTRLCDLSRDELVDAVQRLLLPDMVRGATELTRVPEVVGGGAW